AMKGTYVSGSQVANPVFGSSPIVFTDLGGGKLQWKLPLVSTGSGTISFSAQVANTISPGQVLSNNATIAGPLPDTDTADNTSSGTTTATATSPTHEAIAQALTSAPHTFSTGRPALYTLA